VDVNRTSREALLRVPGFGRETVRRILRARREDRLGLEQLKKLGARLKLARHFIATADKTTSRIETLDPATFAGFPQQLGLLF
jgi:predicted DNA-binding helix-hairpin-helix protein